MKMFKLFLISFLLAAITACTSGGGGSATGGTETGNTASVSIQVIGYQSSQFAAFNLPALTIGDLEVDTAMVVLDRIQFRPLSACQDGEDDEGAEEIRFDGPFIVDLLDPEALSDLQGVEVPAGRYCKIEIDLKKLEGTSGAMEGMSVFIEGNRGDGTAFRMTTEIDEEFDLENETTGFEVDSSASGVFFIAFDLDRWFDGVNLSAPGVEISGDSIILIDDENNEDVQEEIEENLKHSADLFEDSDDDEDLDREEQENSLASGVSAP